MHKAEGDVSRRSMTGDGAVWSGVLLCLHSFARAVRAEQGPMGVRGGAGMRKAGHQSGARTLKPKALGGTDRRGGCNHGMPVTPWLLPKSAAAMALALA